MHARTISIQKSSLKTHQSIEWNGSDDDAGDDGQPERVVERFLQGEEVKDGFSTHDCCEGGVDEGGSEVDHLLALLGYGELLHADGCFAGMNALDDTVPTAVGQ